jgi:hypothetical protein
MLRNKVSWAKVGELRAKWRVTRSLSQLGNSLSRPDFLYRLVRDILVDDAAAPDQSPIVAHCGMTRAMSKKISLCRDFDGDPDALNRLKTSTKQHS